MRSNTMPSHAQALLESIRLQLMSQKGGESYAKMHERYGYRSRTDRSIEGAAEGASPIAGVACPALFFRTFSINASPALYDDRTNGPLAQYRKPSSSAFTRQDSNASGVIYSSTFMWRFVG